MTQKAQILSHLKRGHSLTALQALSLFGVLRLAARIDELRESYRIRMTMERVSSGKRVGVYRLAR